MRFWLIGALLTFLSTSFAETGPSPAKPGAGHRSVLASMLARIHYGQLNCEISIDSSTYPPAFLAKDKERTLSVRQVETEKQVDHQYKQVVKDCMNYLEGK